MVKSLRDIRKRKGESWKKISHSFPDLERNNILKGSVKIQDIQEET
ncbi:hypothetical protein [Methanosarcina mazei]|nr:hypothetical protein [Methanosarcina mazei]